VPYSSRLQISAILFQDRELLINSTRRLAIHLQDFAELAEQFSIFFVLGPGFLNHKPRLFESCNKRGGGLDQRTNQHLGRVIQRLIPQSTVARRCFIYVRRSLYQVRGFAVRGLARDRIQSVF
jgi:hypothetical protein